MKKTLAAVALMIGAPTSFHSFAQKAQLMNTEAQASTNAQHLVDRHFKIWNDRNSAQRLE